MVTSNRSNTWRWVGLIILLIILLLLWLNGHGPGFTGSSIGCCGQSEQLVELSSPEVPPEAVLAEPAAPETIIEAVPAEIQSRTDVVAPVDSAADVSGPSAPGHSVPACSADMNVAVMFDSGSVTLTPDGERQLDMVAQCITEKTEVGGYTDNSGSEKLNQVLSLQRAQAVVAYMVRKAPAMQDLLTAIGHGSDNPIADNSMPEGRAQNRRIEFVKQ